MAPSSKNAGLSVVQEIALEIARLVQTRWVEVDRVSFRCASTVLKLVKTTNGLRWLLNDCLFEHQQFEDVARAFFDSAKADAPEEHVHTVFTGNGAPLMSVRHWFGGAYYSDPKQDHDGRAVQTFAGLLKNPPLNVQNIAADPPVPRDCEGTALHAGDTVAWAEGEFVVKTVTRIDDPETKIPAYLLQDGEFGRYATTVRLITRGTQGTP